MPGKSLRPLQLGYRIAGLGWFSRGQGLAGLVSVCRHVRVVPRGRSLPNGGRIVFNAGRRPRLCVLPFSALLDRSKDPPMLRHLLMLILCLNGLFTVACAAADDARPNILWITSEDNGPHLGCYGDDYATTPNLDALAERSLLYRNCWSNAPVCAPARTTIISGVYPPATGSQHMRSMVPMPDFMRMYPQILRQAGYYCTNNSKEDYNLAKPDGVWDESSRNAHWKNRQDGQPFFAIFNHTISHESQLRKRPHKAVHDPAGVRVPAYHPDTPEVRQDWAQYYDKLTEMDRLVGRNLKELEEAGLADDTIVMYYGDHGSGMPRNKRWPYSSGLRVPLIVHIPEKFAHLRPDDYQAGGETGRLVSFVDLAPTLLSLAGIEPPGVDAGARICRCSRSGAAAVSVRFSRPDGRTLRPGSFGRQRAVRVPASLHAPQDLRTVHQVHVPDADDSGVASGV